METLFFLVPSFVGQRGHCSTFEKRLNAKLFFFPFLFWSTQRTLGFCKWLEEDVHLEGFVSRTRAQSLRRSRKQLALIPARPVGGGSVHSSVLTVTSGLAHCGQIFLLEFSIFTLLCGCSSGRGTNMEKALAGLKAQPPGQLRFLWDAFRSWGCLSSFSLFLSP